MHPPEEGRETDLGVNYQANLSSFDHQPQSSLERLNINEINSFTDSTLLCPS